ncbi:TFIIB-type zinc ribbon-containing protein [Algoriphagus antarcticus]|uniref:Transcription factor zinc-finger domain-containing protein n=1 Tax=Algoriphagus antarcticus TaxID=238540 RepID=A0A3E0DEW1_9BACT|nr:zf-TFIIB domain-containing protein [Algoriphagus antarcticus]REG81246.1 hypothetical protein C8N25_12836 [Algoriphagus antarcticus]
MKCPNCSVNLVMSDRNGVEIDYCPECRGVWLDRGELDKIIERSSQTVKKTQSDGYRDTSFDNRSENDYRQKRKKESFLDNLFDF